jgi:geranylgeranylglycerol-phosphate geranylgeranyltransferase
VLFKGPEAEIKRKEDMMLSYLKILRPSIILLTAFSVIASAFIVGYYQFSLVIAVIVACLVAAAGNVTNDYFDYEIDKINKPKRVLPSGKMKRRTAAYYALGLYVLSIVFAMFLNINMILFALLNIAITIVYAWKLKATFLGHFVDSWLASSIFLFGSLLSGINATIILLFCLSYLGNLAREITKGIEDMEGDRKIGARTLPVITGKMFASWTAISFAIFAVIVSFVPYISGLLGVRYLLVVIVADLIYLFACFVLMVNPTKSQKLMKIGMFVALVAFLVGV